MRNLEELNINERGEPVSRPTPSEADYKEFEDAYGVIFPSALRKLLQHSNGGHPELDSFLPENSPYRERFAVNRFFHLHPDDESSDSFAYVIKHWQKLLGPRALPFAADGGGNIFFLDTSVDPAVVKLCLHDVQMEVILISPNFEAFIDGLEIDPDMI